MANCEIIIIEKIKGNPNLMMAKIEGNLENNQSIYCSPYLMNLSFLHYWITLKKNIREIKPSKLFLDKNEQRVCDWSFLEPLGHKKLEKTSELFGCLMKTCNIPQSYNNNKSKIKQELDPLIDFWS